MTKSDFRVGSFVPKGGAALEKCQAPSSPTQKLENTPIFAVRSLHVRA